jgi:predicted benzoate:H+ symporter BenE
VYAAISKWQSISTIELQLSKSPMLVPYAHILCWTLPAFELIVASLLIFPKSRLIGFYCSYGLMVMFTTYIIAVTRFSEDIPCSCGGILQNMGWDQHLVFNVIFTFLGLLGVLLYGNYKNPKLITMKNRI